MTGRIWILANQGELGGGEVMLHHLATALRELGGHGLPGFPIGCEPGTLPIDPVPRGRAAR